MKPVFQTKRGLGGNCLAACLASIFELELDAIPDLAPPECFEDRNVQPKLLRAWLAPHNLEYLEIDTAGQAFHWVQGAIPSGPCLFAVKSPTPELRAKGYGHFVVGVLCEGTAAVTTSVIHDPLGPVSEPYELTSVGLFVARL